MDTHFEQTLGALAAALGDPTRRRIYLRVREAADPPTAARVAEEFGLHPNVARHHLDRLVDDGYLEVSAVARESGAGRPARRFTASDKEIRVSYPPRRYDLLAELLVRVIENLDPASGPQVAEEVGRRFGRDLGFESGLAGGDPSWCDRCGGELGLDAGRLAGGQEAVSKDTRKASYLRCGRLNVT